MNTKINDLRSALEYLRTIPGQLIETDVEADPRAEISGIYRYVGAKGHSQTSYTLRSCYDLQ